MTVNFEDMIEEMLSDKKEASVKLPEDSNLLVQKTLGEDTTTQKDEGDEHTPYKKLTGHQAELGNPAFNPTIKILDTTKIDKRLALSIPELSANYVLTREVALPILLAWEMGDNVLLTGPTGSGKSSVVKQLCALTNRPFVRINSSGDMDSSHLFGSLVVEGGATVWKDGPVTECVKHGGVLLWDEWDVSPPEITMAMQWLLEKGGLLVIKEMPGTTEERTITPHPDFKLVCSGNTLGQGDETASFAGTEVQNSASLDRFGTTVKIEYLKRTQEVKLLKKEYPSLTEDATSKIVRLGILVRSAYTNGTLSTTMSPRTLSSIAHKACVYEDIRPALKYGYSEKITSDAEKRLFTEMVHKVFGAMEEEEVVETISTEE